MATDPTIPLVTIAPELRAAAPDLRLGCLTATVDPGADGDASGDALGQALEAAAEAAMASLPEDGIAALPAVRATRQAYKALGKDPARYRAASEALLRRIKQGKGLYRVNAVVDVNNLISIRTGIPIGAYDLDKVRGAITFRRAGEGESYVGIGRGPLNLEGLPVFSDAVGPFGSPTSDSERTMIRPETNRLLMVLIAFHGDFGTALDDTAAALAEHAAARNIETTIL